MGKATSFVTGETIADDSRTGFGMWLDKMLPGSVGEKWDKKSVDGRKGIVAVAAAAVAVGSVLTGYAISDANYTKENTSVSLICADETQPTASPGDTLSELGEKKLVSLADAAKAGGISVSPNSSEIDQYTNDNEKLNGVSEISANTVYTLGRICVIQTGSAVTIGSAPVGTVEK